MFIMLRQLAGIRSEARLRRGKPRSLAIRHVDAGSCNGCEHELGAASNPLHDLQRHGLDIVASPRHADILLVTGPVTKRMAGALQSAYLAMPEPRLVAALGDCALGCNVLGDPSELVGALEEVLPVDIRIPGCPPDTRRDRPSHPRRARRRAGPSAPGLNGYCARLSRRQGSSACRPARPAPLVEPFARSRVLASRICLVCLCRRVSTRSATSPDDAGTLTRGLCSCT